MLDLFTLETCILSRYLRLNLCIQDADPGAACKIDDVPIEHGVLPYLLPFAVQCPPKFVFSGQVEGTILNSS